MSNAPTNACSQPETSSLSPGEQPHMLHAFLLNVLGETDRNILSYLGVVAGESVAQNRACHKAMSWVRHHHMQEVLFLGDLRPSERVFLSQSDVGWLTNEAPLINEPLSAVLQCIWEPCERRTLRFYDPARPHIATDGCLTCRSHVSLRAPLLRTASCRVLPSVAVFVSLTRW